MDSSEPDYFEDYALSLYHIGQYEEALEQIQQAFALTEAPASHLYNNRGIIYSMMDDEQSAYEDYEQALALNPENAIAHYNLAGAYYHAGLPTRAEAMYVRAVELDATYALPHLYLAQLYLEEDGDYTRARSHYDQFNALSGRYVERNHRDTYQEVTQALSEPSTSFFNTRNLTILMIAGLVFAIGWRVIDLNYLRRTSGRR